MNSTKSNRYYAHIMLTGYKSLPLIELAAVTDTEAKKLTAEIADKTPGCIGYSTAKKCYRKRVQWL